MSRILLIDDAALMRNLLKRILVPQGYDICGEAIDGVDGVEKYKSLKPDLTLCDISMPGMDGMDCLKKILAFDKDAKVVMCTSQGKENFADEAINAGAKSYIVKPINTKNVTEVVGRVLAGGGVNYKELMMENAERAGLDQKEVLDFFDAFRSLTGQDMDDLSVDRAYLKEKKGNVTIGAEAFLAAKLSLDKINRLVDVFEKLCE